MLVGATVAAGEVQHPPQSDATRLEIRLIRQDGDTQGRCGLTQSVVKKYAELMKEGVVFPPVKVWFDGAEYWLSDGYHRIAAAQLIRLETIMVTIHCGTREDARWDSYSANSAHGLRRSIADIRFVITRALGHPRCLHLSNNELSKHLNVPEATLRRWRRILSSPLGEDPVRIANRGGKQYTINTARIGQDTKRQRSGLSSLEKYRKELREMTDLASPRALPVFNMLKAWAFGKIPGTVCLEGIEDILRGM